MQPSIARRLIELNRKFYADFGDAFSATRGRIQPGVRRVLDSLNGDETILDLGCGNGELARTLARNGHQGAYLGLDFSLPLLSDAESMPKSFPVEFQEADLTANWSVIASDRRERGNLMFDVIFSFATLHHIPSNELRLNILKPVCELLSHSGRFIHSNWQFLNSPRLRLRVQEWSEASLTESDVDKNDYLLDWRSGGTGLRYVHHFSEEELSELAESSGFEIVETFYSDGKEGNLAIYQEWRKQ